MSHKVKAAPSDSRVNDICYLLNDMATVCRNLADKLSSVEGEPLDEREKSFIRLAMIPKIKETIDFGLFNFSMGDFNRASSELEHAHSIMEDCNF